MGDQNHRRGGRGCDRLSLRRPQDDSDTFYDNPVCPCESEEAEPQSEYETSGEWVTYTGDVDVGIFDEAARYAEADVAQKQVPQAQGAGAESSEEWLPVDPVKDEWSAFIAAERAEQAANAAKSALHAAEVAQLSAKAALEAKMPNASQLAEVACSATQCSFDAAEFAKQAADAAKQAAEAAKIAEAQLALAKLSTTSAKRQVFQEKPILKSIQELLDTFAISD